MYFTLHTRKFDGPGLGSINFCAPLRLSSNWLGQRMRSKHLQCTQKTPGDKRFLFLPGTRGVDPTKRITCSEILLNGKDPEMELVNPRTYQRRDCLLFTEARNGVSSLNTGSETGSCVRELPTSTSL